MWLEGQEMLSRARRAHVVPYYSRTATMLPDLSARTRGDYEVPYLEKIVVKQINTSWLKKRMLHASASLKLHIFYSGFSFFEEKRTKIYPNLTSSAVHATVDDGRRCRKQCIRMRSVSCLLVSYYNQSDA
jgi:hypothetical protein